MNNNWANRTIWTGDNLPIMRGMNDQCVDLIYLDPPFNSKTDYAAPIGSEAAGATFKDTWTLQDVAVAWLDLIEAKHPVLNRVIHAAMTPSDKSYLIYMAVRLLEMKRLLKPTGSIYLHCDPTMSHYLKLVMDAIFGRRRFRNEIIWWYRRWPAKHPNFQRMHDIVLRYSISEEATWNQLYDELSPSSIKMWKGKRRVDVKDTGTGRRHSITVTENSKGVPMRDVWDIPVVHPASKQSTGYPTQKPFALLERIIKASSNIDDVVLDPFCGCATTCVAADAHKRQWAGIDISEKAAQLVRQRIDDLTRKIIQRDDIPLRTDLGKLPKYNCKENKARLYGEQRGHCAGCGVHFEMRNLEVDHIIARTKGGTDHIENLQMLCGSCNRDKGDRGMEYLRVKLQL